VEDSRAHGRREGREKLPHRDMQNTDVAGHSDKLRRWDNRFERTISGSAQNTSENLSQLDLNGPATSKSSTNVAPSSVFDQVKSLPFVTAVFTAAPPTELPA